MEKHWILDTHGDPLGKVNAFLRHVWQAADLAGMLVTLDGRDSSHAVPSFITAMAAINQVNPFRPLMEVNAARLIPGLLADHPQNRIAALLRPCEFRALVEMSKHTRIIREQLLTICVDCLGTLPSDEYQWRLERLEKNQPVGDSSDELAHEALKFARQGGIIPYRYRSACQICPTPTAQHADISLHVLGIPVRQKMLVSFKDSTTVELLRIDGYANAPASQTLLQQHDRVQSRMSERHAHKLERLNQGLGCLLPADLDALIRQLDSCGECQKCMDACPICSVKRPSRDTKGHYDRQSVMRWLVSCAGCGMCEQSCPKHLPTASIFTFIRQQLDQPRGYIPGNSYDENIPIL